MNSWQAQVTNTNNRQGVLSINVTYTSPDGTKFFTESIQTDQARPDGWLQDQIQQRLSQLNSLDAYEQAVMSIGIIGGAVLSIDPATHDMVEALPTDSPIAAPAPTGMSV